MHSVPNKWYSCNRGSSSFLSPSLPLTRSINEYVSAIMNLFACIGLVWMENVKRFGNPYILKEWERMGQLEYLPSELPGRSPCEFVITFKIPCLIHCPFLIWAVSALPVLLNFLCWSILIFSEGTLRNPCTNWLEGSASSCTFNYKQWFNLVHLPIDL